MRGRWDIFLVLKPETWSSGGLDGIVAIFFVVPQVAKELTQLASDVLL
jgi:hypothetical protein